MATETDLGKCPQCNAQLVRKGRGPKPKYCSTTCRVAASNDRRKADGRLATDQEKLRESKLAAREYRACDECGVEITLLAARRKFCGKDCYQKSVARSLRERYASDEEFREQEKARRAKRDKGKEAQYRADNKEARSEYNRLYRKRTDRRVLELAAPQGTPYTNGEVFTRDKWICHICGGLTRRAANKNDRLHPQVDHVIPLRRGGVHGLENVATAHRLCNIRKGTKLMDELPAEWRKPIS